MKRGASRTVTLIEVAILLLALAIGLSLRIGAVQLGVIESGSMEPALVKDDRCLLNKRRETIAALTRGEVIIFRWNAGDADTFVKRIVGLPGEQVAIIRGQTFINGQPLTEPYCKEPPQNEQPVQAVVAPNSYFVLGDNRNHSEDSRERGSVARANVVGKLTSIVWPRSRARPVK